METLLLVTAQKLITTGLLIVPVVWIGLGVLWYKVIK